MPSPFPGMDPFLETNPIFQELHTQMLAEMQALLQPQLRPKYVARLAANRSRLAAPALVYCGRWLATSHCPEVPMGTNYTAVVQQHGDWWIGWVEEVPGVNSQGQTREELLDNLRDALEEALEMNRAEARAAAVGAYDEVSLSP
jgi:predicted RNase H-like HicB family nuclease